MEYWNPYELWERKHLSSEEDLAEMYRLFTVDKPTVGGGDTETNGLHIKKAKPFLIIFGWLIPGKNYGRVFTFEPDNIYMKTFFRCAKQLETFVWWNTN